ncbi:3-(3-hydroxy-phenyl)propionate/3-hydroxycinnamic acid hydroxylase [Pigmentiphaga humi]|uniref:3-(3-hydroxy-phenyl)propionate/3-hydroxycinnamic acid hydroxylase n=1 Tax=Pigmentiphaga humi TaxID=2478468 RepID=A0A3P4AZG7_9BURK|nr:FAD-dependent monooxygenase [Pigmentiphaga humi]VCU68961.1 3-(3-hydroxy-phenyl)propionate/3-hydroxycinnamic acid hydroxylase [Pigmentiphaga humi]
MQDQAFPFVPPAEMRGAPASVHPVAIVGAGPVGLTLALTLARHGVPAVLLEDQAQVCTGSRALGMSRRTLEIWAALGAAEAIHARGVVWDGGRSFLRDREILRFRMADDERLRFRPMLNLQQCHTEQYLVEAVSKHPHIDLRWQQRVNKVAAGGDRVELEVQTPEGSYTLLARHVVACDGARSTVRESMGLRLDGSTHEAAYLIADIQLDTETPMGRRCWFDPPSNPGSTVLMHGQPEGVWRLDYQLQPGENQDQAQQPERVKERIARHLDYIGEKGAWTLLWTSLYRAHSRSLADFRVGNVFFAGDAAHLMPIFGIRGLNSGVEDAWNLGWKLALAHHGQAGDALLDSYSAERRKIFLENAALADRNAWFMTPPTEGARLVRDAVLDLSVSCPEVTGIIDPRQASYVPQRDSPLNTADGENGFACGPAPGDVVPDIALPRQEGWLHARLGRSFTALVFCRAEEPDAATLQELRRLSQRCALQILQVAQRAPRETDEATIADPEGMLHDAFGAQAGTVYLVRPDQNVAARWKKPDAGALEAATAKALARHGQSGWAAPSPVVVELTPAERIYRMISTAVNGADRASNALMLAKLAMLLALEVGDPESVRQTIARAGLGEPAAD